MHCAFSSVRAAAVEEALERRASCPAAIGAGGAVTAAGEQAQRERAPDAADAVDGDRADGIVDAEVFQQIDAVDDDDAGNAAEDNRAGRADPVAGAGDGDQAGEEAVDGEAARPTSYS